MAHFAPYEQRAIVTRTALRKCRDESSHLCHFVLKTS